MVSVIIPNYNHARYLKQRIDTVLAQTYREFEVIILDDCSTDNSRDVIAAYKGHPQVSHVILNERNSGSTFIQWQKGIELAKGKYIWIAESDDWCEPTLLQTVVEGLEAKPNAVLGYVQSSIVNGDNDIYKVSATNQLVEYMAGNKYVSQCLGNYNLIINASMALFKRECYYNLSPRYQTFKYCGDWLFWIEIALQGDIFISGKVLNYFRKHGADVSGKMLASGNNHIEEIRVLKLIKQQQLITETEYKSYLLPRFIRYMVFKEQYKADTRLAIEDAFFIDGAISYKKYLTRVGFWNLIKIKLKNRLKL
ncbi:glycosyltransferase family 2 protein [Mucilaginibacter sp. HD30]